MAAVDRGWADRIRAGDARALVRQFEHEARELRRLMQKHPAEMHAPWRDFRRFLADVGPSPGPAFHLQRIDLTRGYFPGGVRWTAKADAVVEAPRPPPASPESSRETWTMMAGVPVAYDELPDRLGVPLAALSAAAASGFTLDEVVANLDEARAEAAELSWFSPSHVHQDAFRQAYIAWRLRVQGAHRPRATTRFLYLFMLLPAMAECKAKLVQAGRWAPRDSAALALREADPAWKRFSELLPKAIVAIAGFEVYRKYSLTDDIEKLAERIGADELVFRATPPGEPQTRAAA